MRLFFADNISFLKTMFFAGVTRRFVPANLVLFILALSLPTSCSYLKYASVQAEYKRIQDSEPGQVNLKHMLERDTFFIVGTTIDTDHRFTDSSLAVAAYSDKFRKSELVDTMFFAGAGTHFGLNLPEGTFYAARLCRHEQQPGFRTR